MTARTVLAVLLAIVATAAAVLSFAALESLGRLCSFGALSALLPIVVDAGAAAGTLAWLVLAGRARSFGRALALVLLAASVAGNGLAHALTAYGLTPPWWVLVAVSAVAPAVLGAVTHLGTLARQGASTPAETAVGGLGEGYTLAGTPLVGTPNGPGDEGSSGLPEDHRSSRGREELDLAEGYADRAYPDGMLDEHGLSRLWETASPAGETSSNLDEVADDGPAPASRQVQVGGATEKGRAAELIAAGAGRRRLSAELNISEHAARALLAGRRNGHDGVAG